MGAELMAPTGEGSPRRLRLPGTHPVPAWVGAWGAVLALTAWMVLLSPLWLVAAGLGAAAWTLLAPGRRLRAAAAISLLAAVSIGGVVQFRLHRVRAHWPEVRLGADSVAGTE